MHKTHFVYIFNSSANTLFKCFVIQLPAIDMVEMLAIVQSQT